MMLAGIEVCDKEHLVEFEKISEVALAAVAEPSVTLGQRTWLLKHPHRGYHVPEESRRIHFPTISRRQATLW